MRDDAAVKRLIGVAAADFVVNSAGMIRRAPSTPAVFAEVMDVVGGMRVASSRGH